VLFYLFFICKPEILFPEAAPCTFLLWPHNTGT